MDNKWLSSILLIVLLLGLTAFTFFSRTIRCWSHSSSHRHPTWKWYYVSPT